tara:strand:+ start:1114 stop:1350 length:237 start_codon:yes stop_codon:yes gene_type:complete
MSGKTYSQEVLKSAFELVQATDWKDPIHGSFSLEDCSKELMRESIIHFTATSPTFKTLEGGRVLVQALGYRMGPAGDH